MEKNINKDVKALELNETEAFYLYDFVSKNWFEFVDSIVDRNNMSELDKEIYTTLKNLSDKIYSLKNEQNRRNK